MTSASDPMHSRLDRLEADNRRLRRTVAGLALCVAALPALAFTWRHTIASPAPEVVQAQKFELVDAEGKVRGRWGFDRKGGPEFQLLDKSTGNQRIRLAIHEDNDPVVLVVDEEQQNRVALAYDGNPHVILSMKGGKPAVHLAVNPEGAGGMLFTHIDGNHNAGIGIHADGRGWLIQRDPTKDKKEGDGK